tara:strand:+ start:730 stop:1917 length:1188 start_codon:yes stop_codon:yes gene_type:complete
MTSNEFTLKNIFKFIFFLSFIDLLLFSIHRLLIKFQLTDVSANPFANSDFLLVNYFILIFCSFGVFLLTVIITIKVPNNKFKIYISRNTFFWLLAILLTSSIYIFFLQQTFRPRYTSGSITTLDGLTRVINTILLVCLFIIYQLNRKQSDYKTFIIILISSILTVDGLAGVAFFLSMALFEFYRLNFKKKISSSIFIIILTVIVLDTAFNFKYGSENSNYILLTGYSDYLYSYIIPRFSVHAEQLYSYISQDLDISNYSYLSTVIMESFNNRLKVIFNDGYDLFYPKTVGQSIAYSMQGLNARGGSSPGYVLSVISFLPFTIPLIIILAFIFKQVSFRLNERVNFIQAACFCFIIKAISANLLDMLPIISPALLTLILVYLSSHVFLKYKEIKET